MNRVNVWVHSITILLVSIVAATAAIGQINDLTWIMVSWFFVMYIIKKRTVYPWSRYLSAAVFGFAAAISFFHIETPFPLMFEIWGDLPKADFVRVLSALQSASLLFILLDFERYRPPTFTTPPTPNLSA
jgi:hypothetical protein